MSTYLRYVEYYGMQEVLDDLYERSKNKATTSVPLYEQIISRENILLAYRVIKGNTGSKTVGTDGITIDDYKLANIEIFVSYIRSVLSNYKPQKVRRVYIPKSNGKKRPLGIPTMRDRIIQQMFLQILEPICEAQFYNHSYGFRPNRSTKHAMARCKFLTRKNFHYVVDIDIKGFFDNVNHNKLIKQLYTIGIKDKRVLAILAKMLKATIEGEGIPKKGTPQGGILSPLLSNVVLNELDWWIANQWEFLKTKENYHPAARLKSLKRKTTLKEMFIVRYADDFKIFTKDHQSAIRIYHGVKGYLSNHLSLDISPEKSKITNLRKRDSEFLGFSLKAVKKRKSHVAHTYITKTKKKQIIENLRKLICEIQKSPTQKSAYRYNAYLLGTKNYFQSATHVNKDFHEIAYRLMQTFRNRLKSAGKYGPPTKANATYKRLHKNNYKTYNIAGAYLYPISDVQTKNDMCFSQDICFYTKKGRKKIYSQLLPNICTEISKMVMYLSDNKNIEYADNRISKYSMQQGLCAVTGAFLKAEVVHCHHKIPKHLGGTDSFDNLVIIHKWVHILIHAVSKETINNYLEILQLNGKQLTKIKHYRELCNLVDLEEMI
ncbi:group II intron reverse transcriptase maturase (plasmid) [Enterococcus mundtii QU 25]|uniref:group II intron reverse transcriptase/maturase n=1 Tax=Enterococcus mundtii TaxID=53346 RepID=UPI0003C55FFE|nr:group II intron reverse transcriptase/maturase [Enterococcus mundtii]BAO08591.1 group II intron reverse transcriptase maturase [Enterococcus mundtii QU 25]